MRTKTAFKDTSDKTVPIAPQDGIQRLSMTTKNRNTLQFFYNADNDLLVVDLVAANENGGNELLRKTLDEGKLLLHTLGY